MTSVDRPRYALHNASRLLSRLRLAASHRLLRTASSVSRGATRFSALATGFASQAIDPADRTALTIALYDQTYSHGRTSFYRWEDAWLTRDLPALPARILLGGAGRGREARILIDRGYTVVAFEPALESVAKLRVRCPEARCFTLDYEALARGSGEAAEVIQQAPFDAALLGWGSLTHVLDERDQDALFATLARLVPRGPLLASFFMVDSSAPGRAAKLGERLGRALGPGVDAYPRGNERVRCMAHIGFTYGFDRSRLEQLAQCAGRTLELHDAAAYPHATFRKRAR